MDVSTLPAPPLALRVVAVAPPHAGASGIGVLAVTALDEHGAPVTAYLHVPATLLARLGADVETWCARQPPPAPPVHTTETEAVTPTNALLLAS